MSEEDQALTRELVQTLGPRFATEVHKAFNFKGFSFETFKLGRYQSQDLGFFKPHRDNVADNVGEPQRCCSVKSDHGTKN